MLCSICRHALQRFWETTEGEVTHHPSLNSLIQAIEESCFLCCFLEDCFKEKAIDIRQPDFDRCTSWRMYPNDSSVSVDILRHIHVYCSNRSNISYSTVQLNVFSLRLMPILDDAVSLTRTDTDASPPSLENFTGSDQTILQIKEWLEICMSTHDSCSQRRRSFWMPSRLLELCDLDKELNIRLLTKSEFKSDRYLTLSHCWGAKGSQKLQLKAETFECFRQGIPVSSLQQTFQDMAKLTARLGFSYFWVDCMCILQDNPEDWRRESSLMGRVYANSQLNISATWATDSSCGCFKHRDLSENYLFVDGPMDSLGRTRPWVLTLQDTWFHQIEHAPVNQRGWVLQERILSPRIAHFTNRQVVWECQQLQASEIFPDENLPDGALYNEQHVKSLGFNSSIKDESHDDIEYRWSRILFKYTSCGLTFSTDRLIALSGIARELNQRRPYDYVAGLWSEDLPHCLMWIYLSPSNESKDYVAPSWSWASRTGLVFGSGLGERSNSSVNMTVLDYATTLSNPKDPFGQITDAYIKLRTRLGVA